MKPTFLTNDDTGTVAEDLYAHITWALDEFKNPIDVAIATAYFNPAGFGLLAKPLQRVIAEGGTVRLLLGAEAVPAYRPPRKSEIPDIIDSAAITARDKLGFTADAGRDAATFVAWLRTDGVQARRLTTDFLHGKAYMVTSNKTSAIVGSSNFTYSGLSRNMELNLGAFDPTTVARVVDWFNHVWDVSDDYLDDLIELFEAHFQAYDPYDVYLRMLLERYGASLDEPEPIVPATLTKFQIDGADRAERILDRWGGVLIADGVGLGKTYLAGELLRRAEQDRRQRTLVIAPRAVVSSWQRYKLNQHLNFDLISFEQLVDWDRSAGPGRNLVLADRNRYALVVVDEAHAFRNDTTQRSEALQQLLDGQPRKRLVLLTATPVNNRLRDLEQLIRLFVQSQSAFVAQGIPHYGEHFKSLEKQAPESLSPEALFPILDEIAVRRTRAFVKEFYPRDTVTIDGVRMPVTFPTAEVNSLRYTITSADFFLRLDHAVSCSIANCADPAHHNPSWPTLTMARYTPSHYFLGVKNSERVQQEGNIAGLLLSGLLKRFESSIFAFVTTCKNMQSTHRAFLSALEGGKVLAGQDLSRLRQALDDGGDPAAIIDGDVGEAADEFDVVALRAAVMADLDLLRALATEAADILASGDSKATRLLDRLHEINAQATTDDERKVLLFSSFSDTVDYFYKALYNHSCSTPNCPYKGSRIAAVTGSDDRGTMADATAEFAPISTEAVPRSSTDVAARRGTVDLLLTTDVLAEGVNLQQACHLINIDLPWNPMRIVQRHGRISRIGSPHQKVILDCFFPDADLEALLSLEDRLRRKIAQANAGIGVEEAPLPGAAASGHVFYDDIVTTADIVGLAHGSAALIERNERGTGGTSGEVFRQELVRDLRGSKDDRDRISRLPAGVGSGRKAGVPDTTYLFCASVAGRDRFVAVRSGSVLSTDTLEVLHAARCSVGEPRVMPDGALDSAYDAWVAARAAILGEWLPLTDASTLRPPVPKVLRDAAQLVSANADIVGGVTEASRLTRRLLGAYGSRIRRRFEELRDLKLSDEEHVARIKELADTLDLQPYTEPKPLPTVTEEDVLLVAWLVLSPGDDPATPTATKPSATQVMCENEKFIGPEVLL